MKNEKNGLRSIRVEFTNFSDDEIDVINHYLVYALSEAKKELEGEEKNE